jgi:hypothetical protein
MEVDVIGAADELAAGAENTGGEEECAEPCV